MSSQTLAIPSPASRPLLIGTDGRVTADSAIKTGAVFANHLGIDVQVFSVLEPLEFDESPTTSLATLQDRRVLVTMAIRSQIELNVRPGNEWPITLLDGPLGPVSRQMALDSNARLVLVGQNRHSMIGRALGQDSAIRILECAVAPVYIAANNQSGIPQCAVAGIDFSTASITAAQTVRELLSENGILYLVHVCSTMHSSEEQWNLEETLNALIDVRKAIRINTPQQIQPIVLFGTPSTELLTFAEGVKADLIACGTGMITPPTSLRHRLHLGSVATRLIDHTSCSIIVTPSIVTPSKSARPNS